MILVWSRKANTKSSCTRRSCWEMEEPVNNRLEPKFGNLHSLQLSHDLQQFLFFINYGYAPISHPQIKVIFRYLRPDASVSTSTVFTAPVGMVTFRQSPCWYYPWADAAVSTFTDSQHLWTWWHFGDHASLINLSVNNIRRIHTRRLR